VPRVVTVAAALFDIDVNVKIGSRARIRARISNGWRFAWA
jgi:hypothetical protein